MLPPSHYISANGEPATISVVITACLGFYMLGLYLVSHKVCVCKQPGMITGIGLRMSQPSVTCYFALIT